MAPGEAESLVHSFLFSGFWVLLAFVALHFYVKGRTGQYKDLFRRLADEFVGTLDMSKGSPVLNFDHNGRRISLYYEVGRSGSAAVAYTRLSTDVPSGHMWFECYSRKGMVLPSKSSQIPTGDAAFDNTFVIWSRDHFDEHRAAAVKSLFTGPFRAAFTEFHAFTGAYSALRVEDGKMVLGKQGRLIQYPLLRGFVETGVKVFDCLPAKHPADAAPAHAQSEGT